MQKIKETFLVSPFLVFFLIHSEQVGVGVLGYQRIIAKFAGYDSWISVIIAAVFVHVLIWMIYYVLDNGDGDIVSIHKSLFGGILGNIFNLALVLYFLLWSLTVLRTYIEVIQVWMFPTLKPWAVAAVFLLLTYYVVSAGFRTVAGICFLGVVIPLGLIFLLFYPLEYTHFSNLLPVFDEKLNDYLTASKNMMLSYLGFETLLVFYPFIKHAKSSQKFAHHANLLTFMMYLLVTLFSFAFFSQEQLARNIWATLSMVKIVQLSFLERFDFVFVSMWCLVILPNITLAVWCSSRVLKLMLNIRHHVTLILLLCVVFAACFYINTRLRINMLNHYTNIIGFYLAISYIPFLFVVTFIKKKIKNKRTNNGQTSSST
ncbi:GerAB/ArcD/ProY family transporter [Fictibacillus phosphorivorans]|uniref:GerAB/ArcD/ProY family transporter n=1 Tax=Fictibacillus phosphorivorans TaxID=1221500 RepID=UPI00203D0F5F|nr:GerAB/ArcD/ProY family transporter [Fictibacillus phosphorivorans]MCM3717418.1 spore germination protein [Fictibacillus phosphorivorans]MCM3775113.1 spore germination protein [Fictibacillus phosphorivorans]